MYIYIVYFCQTSQRMFVVVGRKSCYIMPSCYLPPGSYLEFRSGKVRSIHRGVWQRGSVFQVRSGFPGGKEPKGASPNDFSRNLQALEEGGSEKTRRKNKNDSFVTPLSDQLKVVSRKNAFGVQISCMIHLHIVVLKIVSQCKYCYALITFQTSSTWIGDV